MESLIQNVDHEAIWLAGAALIVTYLLYVFVATVYVAYFGPLSGVPGPRSRALSKYPDLISVWRGTTVFDTKALHDRYGPVVRVRPNQLSYRSAQAWRDINGHKTAGKKSCIKDRAFYNKPINGVDSILSAVDDDDHSRMRRILSHSFSDKALKEQEPLLKTWSNKLVEKLNEAVSMRPDEPVDMVKYWNCATFDVMGDLTFGESLNMLDNGEYSPWVRTIFDSIRAAVRLRTIAQVPGVRAFIRIFLGDLIQRKQIEHFDYSRERVDKRLTKTDARPDLWAQILRRQEKQGLSLEEMHSNSSLFMIAGTETTATLLSGLIYSLLQNPQAMATLMTEIRNTFPDRDSISIETLARMPYLNAVIEEGLRTYPPVPIAMSRKTPQGGAVIDGTFIAEGTVLAVHQYSAFHSSSNFALPDSFIPERWLGDDARFKDDNRAVFQPFSFGPRNCIGKNLAYHEARLLLTEVLWNFDLELDQSNKDWMRQKAFTVWEKKPLWVKLRPRKIEV